EGWELTTNAWGVARAARGMLITTEPRLNAGSHIKDMGETVARLDQARILHQHQAKSAEELGVQEVKVHQSAIAKTLAEQHDAIKGGGGKFPELTSAHLVLASPAGIETTTPQSTHIASDDHTAITTGKSFSIASGDSMFATIRKTFRLLVQKAGMKLVAAGGDIDITALEKNIHALAKLNITHTANRITLSAKEEVVINGGGSYIKYSGKGIEQGTAGKYVSHAAKHEFVGPNSIPVHIPPPPVANIPDAFSNRLDVHDLFVQHEFGDIAYAAKFADGRIFTGRLDEHGRTAQIYDKEEGKLEVLVGKSYDEWELLVDEVADEVAEAVTGAAEAAASTMADAVEQAVSSLSDDPLRGLADKVKDSAVAGALGKLDPNVAGVLGDVIHSRSADPLKALAQGLEGRVIASALSGINPNVANAIGQSVASHSTDPLKALARGAEEKIIEDALKGINPDLAHAAGQAIASDSSDPLKALAHGIENKIESQVNEVLGNAMSDVLDGIKKDLFGKK
ncbi:MAG: hypothetical protein RL748_1775, partial [Pseudomonadota bacterium]